MSKYRYYCMNSEKTNTGVILYTIVDRKTGRIVDIPENTVRDMLKKSTFKNVKLVNGNIVLSEMEYYKDNPERRNFLRV